MHAQLAHRLNKSNVSTCTLTDCRQKYRGGRRTSTGYTAASAAAGSLQPAIPRLFRAGSLVAAAPSPAEPPTQIALPGCRPLEHRPHWPEGAQGGEQARSSGSEHPHFLAEGQPGAWKQGSRGACACTSSLNASSPAGRPQTGGGRAAAPDDPPLWQSSRAPACAGPAWMKRVGRRRSEHVRGCASDCRVGPSWLAGWALGMPAV